LKGCKVESCQTFKIIEKGFGFWKIKKKKLDKFKKISTFAVPTKTGKQKAA